MSSQEQDQSSGAQAQRFDDPELGSGVRDTGVDAPESGQADRAVGTVDEDANPPMSDPITKPAVIMLMGSRQLSATAGQRSVRRHRRAGSHLGYRGVARDRIEAARPGRVFGVAAST